MSAAERASEASKAERTNGPLLDMRIPWSFLLTWRRYHDRRIVQPPFIRQRSIERRQPRHEDGSAHEIHATLKGVHAQSRQVKRHLMTRGAGVRRG